jgi:hypothetical protein
MFKVVVVSHKILIDRSLASQSTLIPVSLPSRVKRQVSLQLLCGHLRRYQFVIAGRVEDLHGAVNLLSERPLLRHLLLSTLHQIAILVNYR